MGNEIENVLLQRDGAPIMQPAMNRHCATDKHHDGCEIKSVKCYPGNHGARVHSVRGKTKDVGAIALFALQFKMDPSEHEWKRDERRDDAAPHDQLVHQPSRKATAVDELLNRHATYQSLRRTARVGEQIP